MDAEQVGCQVSFPQMPSGLLGSSQLCECIQRPRSRKVERSKIDAFLSFSERRFDFLNEFAFFYAFLCEGGIRLRIVIARPQQGECNCLPIKRSCIHPTQGSQAADPGGSAWALRVFDPSDWFSLVPPRFWIPSDSSGW
ncbi:unnamed protein product [Effrenium voratum]|nr:unnamed protein product [Effrenium voratum]